MQNKLLLQFEIRTEYWRFAKGTKVTNTKLEELIERPKRCECTSKHLLKLGMTWNYYSALVQVRKDIKLGMQDAWLNLE